MREVAGRHQLGTTRLSPGIATAHLPAAQLPRGEAHLGRTGARLVPHVAAVQQQLAVELVRVDGELAPFREPLLAHVQRCAWVGLVAPLEHLVRVRVRVRIRLKVRLMLGVACLALSLTRSSTHLCGAVRVGAQSQRHEHGEVLCEVERAGGDDGDGPVVLLQRDRALARVLLHPCIKQHAYHALVLIGEGPLTRAASLERALLLEHAQLGLAPEDGARHPHRHHKVARQRAAQLARVAVDQRARARAERLLHREHVLGRDHKHELARLEGLRRMEQAAHAVGQVDARDAELAQQRLAVVDVIVG
eukprot:scaffold90061_cov66-Phaeocystis_antarctica.AAC.7